MQLFLRVLLLVGTLCLLPAAQTVQAQSNVIDQILITVNGSPITESEMDRRVNWIVFLARSAGQTNFTRQAARNQATQDAIIFRLQQQRARDINLTFSEQEVNDRINSVIEGNNVTAEQFFADLAAGGISQEEFQLSVVEALLNDKLVEREVIPRIRIRDEEIDRYLEVNRSEFLPVSQFNLSVIIATETLTMNFEQKNLMRQVIQDIAYELNRGSDFTEIASAAVRFDGFQAGDLGWVQPGELDPALAREISATKVNQVVGPVVSGNNTFFARINQHRQQLGPDLPELQELRISRIVLQASNEAGTEVNAEQLENLRQTIVDGGDFSEIARVYSHDSTTRKEGGDLGWVPEDSLPFEYLGPLGEMEVGDISPVQQIGNIVFIIKFEGAREASTEQRMRSLARLQLRNVRLRNERANWIDELRENAVIDFRETF